MRRHRGVLFAPALVNALRETHAAGGAAVLYINRRGLSRHVTCADCGTPLSCPDCGVSFVLYSGGVLACRYCGKTTTAPRACPVCTSPVFRYKAPGIEMAVRDAAGLLPDAQVCPVTTESESPPASQSIVNRQSPILIGTRALLGVEWPERTGLVAALSVDDDLCLPDFRARERTFQVLSSLMRRADRFGARLILQTRRPDDVAVQSAVVRDTRGFLDRELEARKELRFPPFRRLVLVELHAGTEARAATRAESLCSKLGRVPGVEVLGPVPVPGRKHAVQMLVKLERRLRFDRLVRVSELESAGVRAKIDVDPLETMP